MWKFLLPVLIGAAGGFIAFFSGVPFPAVGLFRLLLYFTAALFLGVFVHELGHLVFGALSGYRFSSFRIGPFVLVREDGRILFRFSRSIVEGQCLMVPPAFGEDFPFILYNLGGVLFNIALAVLVLPFAFAFGNVFAGLVVAVNLFFALINAVPVRSLLLNDGVNVLEAMKSRDAARGLYLMLFVNSEITLGRRYMDFDEGIFAVPDGADLRNFMVAYILMLEAARLEDLGRFDEFADVYSRLDIDKLPGLYGIFIKADLLYYYTFYAPDYEKAREIYSDKRLQQVLGAAMPNILRISAAYEFFVLGEKEKAIRKMKRARAAVRRLPNKGQRLMESEYLENLIAKAREVHYG